MPLLTDTEAVTVCLRRSDRWLFVADSKAGHDRLVEMARAVKTTRTVDYGAFWFLDTATGCRIRVSILSVGPFPFGRVTLLLESVPEELVVRFLAARSWYDLDAGGN